MLTDKPNIVIAKPPKRVRSRKPKAAAAATRIVEGAKTEPISAEDHAGSSLFRMDRNGIRLVA